MKPSILPLNYHETTKNTTKTPLNHDETTTKNRGELEYKLAVDLLGSPGIRGSTFGLASFWFSRRCPFRCSLTTSKQDRGIWVTGVMIQFRVRDMVLSGKLCVLSAVFVELKVSYDVTGSTLSLIIYRTFDAITTTTTAPPLLLLLLLIHLLLLKILLVNPT